MPRTQLSSCKAQTVVGSLDALPARHNGHRSRASPVVHTDDTGAFQEPEAASVKFLTGVCDPSRIEAT